MPSRSRKSPRRSASRPGWSRTRARRSWRSSFSFAGGSASDPESQKGADQPHGDAADRRRGAARLRRPSSSARRMPPSSLGFGASLDTSAARCALLSANRDEGFELLRLARHRSRASMPDMVEQRRAQIDRRRSTRPTSARHRSAQRTMMATCSRAIPMPTTPRGVRENLQDPHGADSSSIARRPLLTRNGLIVAAVGDIDAAELARLLDRAFGSLPAGTPPAAAARLDAADQAAHRHRRAAGAAEHGPDGAARRSPRDDPDWYAALVLNAHPGRRRPAVAAVQRGAREARPGLRRLAQRCAVYRGQRCW